MMNEFFARMDGRPGNIQLAGNNAEVAPAIDQNRVGSPSLRNPQIGLTTTRITDGLGGNPPIQQQNSSRDTPLHRDPDRGTLLGSRTDPNNSLPPAQQQPVRDLPPGPSRIAPLLHDPASRAGLHEPTSRTVPLELGQVAPTKHYPRAAIPRRQLSNFHLLLHSMLGAPALILATCTNFLRVNDSLI